MKKRSRLSKKDVKIDIDEIIENLRQCEDDPNCKRCSERHECLSHTRVVLAWILEVFSNRMDIDENQSRGVYL